MNYSQFKPGKGKEEEGEWPGNEQENKALPGQEGANVAEVAEGAASRGTKPDWRRWKGQLVTWTAERKIPGGEGGLRVRWGVPLSQEAGYSWSKPLDSLWLSLKINPSAKLTAALWLQERKTTSAGLAVWCVGVSTQDWWTRAWPREEGQEEVTLYNMMNFALVVFGYMKSEFEGSGGGVGVGGWGGELFPVSTSARDLGYAKMKGIPLWGQRAEEVETGDQELLSEGANGGRQPRRLPEQDYS